MLLFSGYTRPSNFRGPKSILGKEVSFRNIFGVTLQKNSKYASSFTAFYIIISCNPPIRGHNTITYYLIAMVLKTEEGITYKGKMVRLNK